MDFEIILQECFLGDPLPKLLKPFHSIEQNGRERLCAVEPHLGFLRDRSCSWRSRFFPLRIDPC